MFYSAQHAGFYHPDIHGAAIPADAVEINDAAYSALIDAQTQGAVIQPDELGMPVAIFPVPPTDEDLRDRWRASAELPRADFLVALVGAELLSGTQAEAAARGTWPTDFNACLPDIIGQTGKSAVAVRIDWACALTIRRDSPLVAALLKQHAAEHGLHPETAAQLGDLIFGWAPPRPPAPD